MEVKIWENDKCVFSGSTQYNFDEEVKIFKIDSRDGKIQYEIEINYGRVWVKSYRKEFCQNGQYMRRDHVNCGILKTY